MNRRSVLEREVVDPLALLGGAEREQRHDLRLPAREERRAVRARRDADLARDRADLLRAAPVRAPLVDGDLLADEVLVDRLGRPLQRTASSSSPSTGASPSAAGGPTGNGSSTRLDDAVEEQLPLRRLELLRVLLGLGERAQVVLELLPHRCFDRLQADRLAGRRRGSSGPGSAGGCPPRSSPSSDLGGQSSPSSSSTTAPRLAQAVRLDVLADARRRCGSLSSAVTLGVEPLRLAGLLAELLLRLAELDDLPRARSRAPASSVSSGTSSAPASTIVRPSFVPTTIRSSVDGPPSAAASG